METGFSSSPVSPYVLAHWEKSGREDKKTQRHKNMNTICFLYKESSWPVETLSSFYEDLKVIVNILYHMQKKMILRRKCLKKYELLTSRLKNKCRTLKIGIPILGLL